MTAAQRDEQNLRRCIKEMKRDLHISEGFKCTEDCDNCELNKIFNLLPCDDECIDTPIDENDLIGQYIFFSALNMYRERVENSRGMPFNQIIDSLYNELNLPNDFECPEFDYTVDCLHCKYMDSGLNFICAFDCCHSKFEKVCHLIYLLAAYKFGKENRFTAYMESRVDEMIEEIKKIIPGIIINELSGNALQDYFHISHLKGCTVFNSDKFSRCDKVNENDIYGIDEDDLEDDDDDCYDDEFDELDEDCKKCNSYENCKNKHHASVLRLREIMKTYKYDTPVNAKIAIEELTNIKCEVSSLKGKLGLSEDFYCSHHCGGPRSFCELEKKFFICPCSGELSVNGPNEDDIISEYIFYKAMDSYKSIVFGENKNIDKIIKELAKKLNTTPEVLCKNCNDCDECTKIPDELISFCDITECDSKSEYIFHLSYLNVIYELGNNNSYPNFIGFMIDCIKKYIESNEVYIDIDKESSGNKFFDYLNLTHNTDIYEDEKFKAFVKEKLRLLAYNSVRK